MVFAYPFSNSLTNNNNNNNNAALINGKHKKLKSAASASPSSLLVCCSNGPDASADLSSAPSSCLLSLPPTVITHLSASFLSPQDFFNFRRLTCKRLELGAGPGLLGCHGISNSSLDAAWARAISTHNNPLSIIGIMLHSPSRDPSVGVPNPPPHFEFHGLTLSWAASKGHSLLVKLLLADPRVDPAAQNNENYAIQWAAANGHDEVVALLLADARVHPAADNNLPIRFASQNGHLQVLKLLLADSRVDPAADDNYAIKNAAKEGHLQVLKLLLADSRVDPAADDNYAVKYAAQYGHDQVIKLLLADTSVNPAADDNFAIKQATQRGWRQVVELLLLKSCKAVDPNLGIVEAAGKGQLEVLRVLLADERANPVFRNHAAIKTAAANGHRNVVWYLLGTVYKMNSMRSAHKNSNNKSTNKNNFYPLRLIEVAKHEEYHNRPLLYDLMQQSLSF